jgi:hypothetical protein
MIPGVKVIGTNLACNEPIPLPTDVVLFGSSTVVLGFTLGDLIAALVRWAVQIVIQYVMKFLGKVLGAVGKRFAGWVGRRLAGRFTSGLGAKVSNFLANLGRTGAAKGPPGFLKRMHLNALGRLNMPKVFNQPAATRGPFGALDRFFGQGYVDDFLRNRGFPIANAIRPGQFQSVADNLIRAETALAQNAAKKFGLPAAQDALGIGGGPQQYSPSLADRFGSWIDGSSEMVNP